MDKMLPHYFQFSSVKRRKVEASFSGGDITSNAGVLCYPKLIGTLV